jgi:hypothetical protein
MKYAIFFWKLEIYYVSKVYGKTVILIATFYSSGPIVKILYMSDLGSIPSWSFIILSSYAMKFDRWHDNYKVYYQDYM